MPYGKTEQQSGDPPMNYFIQRMIRQLFRTGMREGMDTLARGGKAREDLSNAEREAANATRGNMRQGMRVLNMARRFMR